MSSDVDGVVASDAVEHPTATIRDMSRRGTLSDIGEIEELARRARVGNADAAARLIALCYPYWITTAVREVRRVGFGGEGHEPSDMVQDAVLKLLDLWDQGKGPASNTRAYVAAMIRNGYANGLRSPRTREQRIDDVVSDGAVAVVDDVSRIDLWNEASAVRDVYGKLAPDHRAVLREVVVNGRKPAELVEELGRPAPAVSSLLARAKHALRRGLLVTYLNEGGPECAANTGTLPKYIHNDYRDHDHDGTGAWAGHVRSCERCQRNWRRFAAVGGTLGVLPLLVVAQLALDPSQAAAAATYLDRQEPRAPSPRNRARASTPDAPQVALSGAATPPLGSRWSRLLSSKKTFVAGLSLVIAAVMCLASLLISVLVAGEWWETTTEYTGSEKTAAPYGVDIDAWLDFADAGTIEAINVVFDITEAEQWSLIDVRLDFPGNARLDSTPDQMTCTTDAASIVCVPDPGATPGEALTFTFAEAPPRGSFTFSLSAEADGQRVNGYANGSW